MKLKLIYMMRYGTRAVYSTPASPFVKVLRCTNACSHMIY